MKSIRIKIILVLAGLFCLASCGSGGNNAVNWNITMDPNGKEPFGTYLFSKALYHYFPQTPVHLLKSNFNFTQHQYTPDANELMILIGQTAFFSEAEFRYLMDYVYSGNHLILSAGAFDTLLQHSLFFTLTDKSLQGDGELKILHKEKVSQYEAAVALPAQAMQPDTAYDSGVKGYYNNYPDLILYRWGDGTIMIHTNPIEFTNISMLGDNKKYIEELLGFRNGNRYTKIIFSSFMHHDNRVTDFDLLLQYPSFRWAFYLLLVLLAAFILFEFKRRQKMVPEIAVNNNNTQAFIETIGHLYFNEGNLNNLAEKKILYFLDFVRSRYYIDTRHIDEHFAESLHIKSQVPLEKINILISLIRKVQDRIPLDSQDIFTLDSITKLFNHGHHK